MDFLPAVAVERCPGCLDLKRGLCCLAQCTDCCDVFYPAPRLFFYPEEDPKN